MANEEYLVVINKTGRRELLGIFKCQDTDALWSMVSSKSKRLRQRASDGDYIEYCEITNVSYSIDLTGRVRSNQPPFIHSFHYDEEFGKFIQSARWNILKRPTKPKVA
ncbi:hypothetical protein [Photobacterium sp. GB-72]|uniref:hypothetical protein n=1 Tax=Photobacterium sp. GB-72 TaxID=2022105 RepID=UPI000D17BF06|nr:hypothetical protein [Photobacterium sp. GB-72]PSV27672.1 hypothetical protein C9J40_20260 [Photobacterium sp. GB-72]